MGVILGVLIGVATGLVSWWVVTRLLTPRLGLSADISKLGAQEFGPWRYRVKIANLHRIWCPHVLDVRCTAKLRIKGLNSKGWADYPIPVGHSGEMDLVERNAVPRLQIHRMRREHLELLARALGISSPQGLLTEELVRELPLERLLSLGSQDENSRSEVRVVLSAAHPYTGARRGVVRHYRSSAIVCGRFSAGAGRKGLKVVPNGDLCQDSMPGTRTARPPTATSMISYFAYGSNMAPEVIARLCPGYRYVGVAHLPDHRLAFTRRSVKTGSGVADIVYAPGQAVWGVLYEIDHAGLTAIDRKEGYDWAYTRVSVPVLLEPDDSELTAHVYTVRYKEPTEIAPSRQYLDRLIAAARGRGLPDPYIERLEGIAANE